jgi:hypothetical protein
VAVVALAIPLALVVLVEAALVLHLTVTERLGPQTQVAAAGAVAGLAALGSVEAVVLA